MIVLNDILWSHGFGGKHFVHTGRRVKWKEAGVINYRVGIYS